MMGAGEEKKKEGKVMKKVSARLVDTNGRSQRKKRAEELKNLVCYLRRKKKGGKRTIRKYAKLG